MSWLHPHLLLRVACVAAIVASVGCGDDETNGSNGGTGATGGDDVLDAYRQGYANLCVRICQSTARCLIDDTGVGRALIARCGIDCEETTRELDPDDFTQACLDASSDSVFCYENVDCESVYDGSACREENDRAFETCPRLGDAACDFECSGCPSDTIRAVCHASVITCATTACCAELDSLFAQCVSSSGECNFDCSLCTGEPRNLCEGHQEGCGSLSGEERTVCCNDVTAIYSIMCRS